MRRYHQTETAYWQDAVTWTADERFLGIYLQTCSHRTSTEGLYRLLPQYAAIETGWTVELVTETLQALVARGWLGWDAERNIVLLRSALERQPPRGDRQIKGALAAVAQIPRESPLFAEFVALAEQHCPALAALITSRPTPPDDHRTGSDTPSDGVRRGIEGVSEDSSDSTSTSVSTSEGGGGERASANVVGADSANVVPGAWSPATKALITAGLSSEAITAQSFELADVLRGEDRPVAWPQAGRWLRQKRDSGECEAGPDAPVSALRFLLRSRGLPLVGQRPRRQPGQRSPIGESAPDNTLTSDQTNELWQRIHADAQTHIGDDAWDTWLSVITVVSVTDREVWIACPDHAKAWISHRLLPLLSSAATRQLDRPVRARIHGYAPTAVSA